jgi:hypothetical protein
MTKFYLTLGFLKHVAYVLVKVLIILGGAIVNMFGFDHQDVPLFIVVLKLG